MPKKPYSPTRMVLQWLIEFGPTLLFFISYQLVSFLTAIAINFAATVVMTVVAQVVQKRIAPFPIFMVLFVGLFGGFSLYFEDPTIFILQHTVYYGFCGAALLVSSAKGGWIYNNFFDQLFAITDRGWQILERRWGIFLLLITIANELVWRSLGYDEWVIFKFSINFLMVIFGTYNFKVAKAERLPEASPWGLRVK